MDLAARQTARYYRMLKTSSGGNFPRSLFRPNRLRPQALKPREKLASVYRTLICCRSQRWQPALS